MTGMHGRVVAQRAAWDGRLWQKDRPTPKLTKSDFYSTIPLTARLMRTFMVFLLSAAVTIGCGKATPDATSHQKAASTTPEKGTAKETEMSFDAMKAAAENGDPRAQSALGYAYDVGQGVTQDLATAAHRTRLRECSIQSCGDDSRWCGRGTVK